MLTETVVEIALAKFCIYLAGLVAGTEPVKEKEERRGIQVLSGESDMLF